MTQENTIQRMTKIRNFLYSDFYLALVSIVVFIGWVSKSTPLAFVSAIILACFGLLVADDILPLTINLFSACLLLHSHTFDDYTYMWPLVIPLAICLVYFLVKNGRHKFTLGKMFFPLLAVAFVLLLGGVGTIIKQDFLRVIPDFFLLGVGVPVFYILYNHYLKRDSRRDIPLYFSKTMTCVGLLMSLQLIITIATSHIPVHEWSSIVWDVGWATRNGLATYMIFGAGMTMYLSTRYRQGWIFLALGVLQYACIILTFSRGGIIFGILSGFIALIFTIIKAPNKKLHLLYIGVLVLIALIVYLCLMKDINTMVSTLLGRGFGTSNRDKLYKEAWELFKAHPIFGVGRGYLGSNTPSSPIGTYWFHSTLFQVLACMGIIGLIAYAYFYIVRFGILFKNFKHTFNLFCLAVFVGFEGYSMINTGTFIAYPDMAIVIVMTLLMERVQEDWTGYPTPYNYGTPWGDKIVQRELALEEKIYAKLHKGNAPKQEVVRVQQISAIEEPTQEAVATQQLKVTTPRPANKSKKHNKSKKNKV